VSQRRALVAQYLKKKRVAVSWLLLTINLSRNAWYYQASDNTKTADIPIVEQIKSVLIESPYYGYRRVTAALQRQDKPYNHKRILRIMGKNLLIQPRRRRTHPRTTNSNHDYMVYANEIRHLDGLVPRAEGRTSYPLLYAPTTERRRAQRGLSSKNIFRSL
jgi:hypothetical protein